VQLFAYPWDLADEGIESTVARIRSWGFSSIAVAVNYHTAKLLLPHNPKRKVFFPEAGRFYLPLETDRYAGETIAPLNSEWSRENAGFWERLRKACDAEGLAVTAWTIGFHNTTLGCRHPELVCRNAFGDPYYFCLCPSREEARRYVVRTTAEAAARSVIDRVFLESFHFMDFEHGYHHEMTGIFLSETAKRLLAYCFCDACMSGGTAFGADMKRARAAVSAALEAEFGGDRPLPPGELSEAIGPLDEYRKSVVTSLMREIRGAVSKPIAMFIKPPTACEDNGVDLAALSEFVDWFETYCYEPGVERIGDVVNAFSGLDRTRLRLALRAGHPDVASPEELAARLEYVRTLGLAGVSLYNYGQAPLAHWSRLSSIQIQGE